MNEDEYFRAKASAFIDRYVSGTHSTLGEPLRLLLKEVSRDTRHACAEAVNAIPRAGIGSATVIFPGDAHAACMNASPQLRTAEDDND